MIIIYILHVLYTKMMNHYLGISLPNYLLYNYWDKICMLYKFIFKEYISGVFNRFTEKWNHYHYLIFEHVHHPDRNPYPFTVPPISPSHRPGNHPYGLPILGILYKQNYTTCGLLWLAYSTQCVQGLCCNKY